MLSSPGSLAKSTVWQACSSRNRGGGKAWAQEVLPCGLMEGLAARRKGSQGRRKENTLGLKIAGVLAKAHSRRK